MQCPKLDLHAHLNGSASEKTLFKLLEIHKEALGDEVENIKRVLNKTTRTLEECFEMFAVIHQLTRDLSAMELVTEEVIKEFAADGCKYLELRTTPRENKDTGMTRKAYVETVLRVMNKVSKELDIYTRLILSIDRRQSLENAIHTVNLAAEYKSQGVVGIDFSGNPIIGHARDFEEAFTLARSLGLKMTIHFAEVKNDDETEYILTQLKPHRVGHGTVINESNMKIMLQEKIPLEICLTSNVRSLTVPSYGDHHLSEFSRHNYPLIICTDDKGVFETSLGQEYQYAKDHSNYSDLDICRLGRQALNYIFEPSEEIRQELNRIWEEYETHLLENNGPR